jgi:chromosome segregation ATPase
MINPRRLPTSLARAATFCVIAIALGGCASAKYSALEKVGIHKRDILVDDVEDARDSQAETREHLVSAYEELSALIGHDGGDLERQYKRLNKEVDRARDAIAELDDRLESIDRVSEDLFEEWESELELYSSQVLRNDQARKLAESRKQFRHMRDRMQVARNRVDPVMAVLNDNVLYLKHSLNAQAVAALRGEAANLEADVEALIRDMQIAIDEADAFITRMRG